MKTEKSKTKFHWFFHNCMIVKHDMPICAKSTEITAYTICPYEFNHEYVSINCFFIHACTQTSIFIN